MAGRGDDRAVRAVEPLKIGNRRGRWSGQWAAGTWIEKTSERRSSDGWTRKVKPGDVVVMDTNGVFEGGNIGSNNSLGCAEKGIVSVVTNGGARDTDEIVKVKRPPVYCRNGHSTRGVRPGRMITESYNFPINCAGVLVYPGDVVVGDGDGVIVVPREHALEVGRHAREIHDGDQASRAKRFDRLGIPRDQTVEEY